MSLSKVPPQKGVLHTYGFNLTAFEFTGYSGEIETEAAANILLFIGGLGNGLLNVPYLPALAEAASTRFHANGGGKWSLVQVLLGSAYSGWGTASLERDSSQLAKAIEYFRSYAGGRRKKIVVMGHSTGCQNSLHYLSTVVARLESSSKAQIEGAILQAPVSDQEALRASYTGGGDFEQLTQEVYDEYIATGRDRELLPEKYRKIAFNVPITAYRFYSLAAKRGDDDFFSSYLTQEDLKETFGKVSKPLLLLYSGSDQFVPAHVDKQQVFENFEKATPASYWSKYSRIIPGGTHDLGEGSEKDVILLLTEAVANFINAEV
ncbi:uncharacterized protein LODBEIA_P15090 [Lodderomyces beijingensis]|uniref:DUF1749-domain-containing protein n=1 Tax=Lodderomyces beijingensis TaxID=1775926 RepID=A0ABP0ZGJ2_9ASCO